MLNIKTLVTYLLGGLAIVTAGIATFNYYTKQSDSAPVVEETPVKEETKEPSEKSITTKAETKTKAVTSQTHSQFPQIVSTLLDLEDEYLNLDEEFNNELKNIYPKSTDSDIVINNSISSAQIAKDILSNLTKKVNDIATHSYINSQSGLTKDWFALCKQCYSIRQNLYSKYFQVLDNQIILLKAVKIENVLIASLDGLAQSVKEILLYTSSKDKLHLLESADKGIVSLNKAKESVMEIKKTVPLPAYDNFVKYANDAIAFLNAIKLNVETVGFTDTPTADDQALLVQAIALGKQRTDILALYQTEVADWIFTNRDSPLKDIDRLFIEANQICDKAYASFKALFPDTQ